MAVHGLEQPKFYLAKSALKSSVVLQAVQGHFRNPNSNDIVFGKETAIELLVVSSHGSLQSICEQSVFGSIIDLCVLPWNGAHRESRPEVIGKDLLVLLSDSGKLSFVAFFEDAHRFVAVSHVHLASPEGSYQDLGHQLAVESSGRAVAVAAFENRLAIFPASSGSGDNVVEKGVVYPYAHAAPSVANGKEVEGEDMRSEALGLIWSMAFVNSNSALGDTGSTSSMTREGGENSSLENLILLAVLVSRMGRTEVQVLVYSSLCKTIKAHSKYLLGGALTSTPLATVLIPVPAIPNTVLIGGAEDLLLLEVCGPSCPRVIALAQMGIPNSQAAGATASQQEPTEGHLLFPGDRSQAEESSQLPNLSQRSTFAAEEWPRQSGSRGPTEATNGSRENGSMDNDAESTSRFFLTQSPEEIEEQWRHIDMLVQNLEEYGPIYPPISRPWASTNPPAIEKQVKDAGTEMADKHSLMEERGIPGTVDETDSGNREPTLVSPSGRQRSSLPLVCAWSWEAPASGWRQGKDVWGPRLIVGSDSGSLYIVQLHRRSQGPRTQGSWVGEEVALSISPACWEGPSCSALLWLQGGLVAAAGEMADGCLLQMKPDGHLAELCPLQNLSPIQDFALVDYHGEAQDQMFACCGAGSDATLRILRNGVNVERLLSTPPAYPGITGAWTLRLTAGNLHHVALVMSFVQETRVLSVGVSFQDITDLVGFNPDASTLACGRVADGCLAQICADEVRACCPAAPLLPWELPGACPSQPLMVACWHPELITKGASISVGAAASGVILVALSRPSLLVMLGLEGLPSQGCGGEFRLVEIQRCTLGSEISCISLPLEDPALPLAPPKPGFEKGNIERSRSKATAPGMKPVCIVGTYKPTAELLSLAPGDDFRVLASADMALALPGGSTLAGCIPENVLLAQFDKLYLLAGLRNGMLLSFQWPLSEDQGPGPQLRERQTGATFIGRGGGLSTTDANFRADANGFSEPTSIYRSKLGRMLQGGKGPASSASALHLAESSEGKFLRSPKVAESQQRDAHLRNGLLVGQGQNCPDCPNCGNEQPHVVEAELELAAVRRIGVSPVSLVPLGGALGADVLALSDRPWLVRAALPNRRVTYTSVSFQAASHAAPFTCPECPQGLVLVADCCLHLVELEHSKSLSVQHVPLGAIPRRLAFHPTSRTLVLLCTTPSIHHGEPSHSEVRCIDPLSGATLATHRLDPGEVALSLQLWAPDGEQLLAVGTRIQMEPPFPDVPGKSRGRLIVFKLALGDRDSDSPSPVPATVASSFPSPIIYSGSSVKTEPGPGLLMLLKGKDVKETVNDARPQGDKGKVQGKRWSLRLYSSLQLPAGGITCLSPYLGRYLLAGAGNTLFCLELSTNEWRPRVRRLTSVRTRFPITSISCHLARIAVSDTRDGVLLFSFREDTRQLELLAVDPLQRLVADVELLDTESAMASDRKACLTAMTFAEHAEESQTPERNLGVACHYHLGEVAMCLKQGSLAYRAPEEVDDLSSRLSPLGTKLGSSLVAATMLGSVVVLLQLTAEEYALLELVERCLASYPLTAPLLGNNHARFRTRNSQGDVCRMLDGDMLGQFLDLAASQQEAVLAIQPGQLLASHLAPNEEAGSRGRLSMYATWHDLKGPVHLEHVVSLLERIDNSLS